MLIKPCTHPTRTPIKSNVEIFSSSVEDVFDAGYDAVFLLYFLPAVHMMHRFAGAWLQDRVIYGCIEICHN